MCCCFCLLMILRPPRSPRTDTLVPYTTLFRSERRRFPSVGGVDICVVERAWVGLEIGGCPIPVDHGRLGVVSVEVNIGSEVRRDEVVAEVPVGIRSEERRVGNECVGTGSAGWWRSHYQRRQCSVTEIFSVRIRAEEV